MGRTVEAAYNVIVRCSPLEKKEGGSKAKAASAAPLSQGRDWMHIELNISTARKTDSAAETALSKPVFPFGSQSVCSSARVHNWHWRRQHKYKFRKALEKKTGEQAGWKHFLMYSMKFILYR